MKAVNTVTGPIEVDQLGVTLTHEHLLINTSNWVKKPEAAWELELSKEPVRIGNLGAVRRQMFISGDNLRLEDPEVAAEELVYYKRAGGRSLVDLTLDGIGRNPAALQKIARKTGVNIICSTGYYVQSSHPPRVARSTVGQLAEVMTKELQVGIGDTGIRAGIIGEIGVSPNGIKPDEEKVLRAAARAHGVTGMPIYVHCWDAAKDDDTRTPLRVVDILEEGGVDPRKICIAHLDWYGVLLEGGGRDWGYVEKVARRGVRIGIDGFGNEWPAGLRDVRIITPTDYERVLCVKKLIEWGYLKSVFLAHDNNWKTHMRRYGGHGYDHLLTNIMPLMRMVGISARDTRTMMVENPRRFFS